MFGVCQAERCETAFPGGGLPPSPERVYDQHEQSDDDEQPDGSASPASQAHPPTAHVPVGAPVRTTTATT